MARLKIVYIGGGGTRAPGTLESFIHQAANFAGSELVLVDLDEANLQLVQQLATKMAKTRDADLTFSATTDRRAALKDANAVLSSFRPGGFEARLLDEQVPLKYGIIGQETQGPGGFFMALRAIHCLKQIADDMQHLCPNAWLFNYTNPVNIVSQALADHTSLKQVSLCEGPIAFAQHQAEWAGLDPAKVDVTMIGLNHACWSIRHLYDGQPLIPLLAQAHERLLHDPAAVPYRTRLLGLTAMMDAVPSQYFRFYYFHEQEVAELLASGKTRSQEILASVPDYWLHYREQLQTDKPLLDPTRSRGGIHEFELAIDVMDAIFNDRRELWPVNVVNHGALPDFPNDLVVELPAHVDRQGLRPLLQSHLPRHLTGLLHMLGNYQSLAAQAAWHGTRRDAIRALASHPLVFSLKKATAIYDELAAAHQAYLPKQLLKN
ncbi:MAG: hypothetical protein FWD61_01370 [Phycisphaerales bacterium]|nr:hypothetical protein [Phycisphaerales bacterium]